MSATYAVDAFRRRRCCDRRRRRMGLLIAAPQPAGRRGDDRGRSAQAQAAAQTLWGEGWNVQGAGLRFAAAELGHRLLSWWRRGGASGTNGWMR